MQEYQNDKLIKALTCPWEELKEIGEADIISGKADSYVIGEMPRKGTTITINGLTYDVFSVTGGTVVLKLRRGGEDNEI